MSTHESVMLKETIRDLNLKPGGTYVDMTFGRGGHTKQMMKKLTSGTIIGLDLDDEAIKEGRKLVVKEGITFHLVKANFKDVISVLESLEIQKVDGILLDLGVSSPQFDTPERGFSYRFDSKLDMRMDPGQMLTAYDIVNKYSAKALFYIFKEYGEEKFSRQIAEAIERSRLIKPIETTFELVEIIKSAIPKRILFNKDKHPAKQVFQALRIETNGELENLKEVLKAATSILNVNGRLVILTYHSLEDRIVKHYFKELTTIEGSRLNIPTIPNQDHLEFGLVYRKAVLPSEEELAANPRSHSAKLRVLERK